MQSESCHYQSREKLPAQEGTAVAGDVVDGLSFQEPLSINVMIGQTASYIQPEYSPVGI